MQPESPENGLADRKMSGQLHWKVEEAMIFPGSVLPLPPDGSRLHHAHG